MGRSILKSTKKILGLPEDYTSFDTDIITHINTVFFTLNQLGVGPLDGFSIEGEEETWEEYETPHNVQAVRSYVYIKVRLLFDPPATSFAIESLQKQATELEWRLNVHMEGVRSSIEPIS